MVLEFSATINIREGNPYILVSKTRAIKIKSDWRKPMPVMIRLNGSPKEPWHINMMPVGDGSFYLYLHSDIPGPTNTKVGDKVMVSIEFDSGYKNGPQHEMSEWFGAALAKNSAAQANWQNLSPSRQKEVLRYFSWLKSDDAKQRNLERVMHVLSGKAGHFMGRDWRDGK